LTGKHNDSLLQFPCDFPIKVIGRRGDGFQRLVADIVGRHAPDLDLNTLRTRTSRNGAYQSVTLVVRADNRAQLDAIYRELTAHEQVMMAL
jgi:putative lipoic acid-binding regulatory protein